ncbi:hypothetical protein QR685DRAFT_545242 [Neurospora intermedia]|uniref:Uncharacterized protein n=1 Tax=Neurospora intermedia TaxID=5142 RepID=A0ABR3DAN9_NEUIN
MAGGFCRLDEFSKQGFIVLLLLFVLAHAPDLMEPPVWYSAPIPLKWSAMQICKPFCAVTIHDDLISERNLQFDMEKDRKCETEVLIEEISIRQDAIDAVQVWKEFAVLPYDEELTIRPHTATVVFVNKQASHLTQVANNLTSSANNDSFRATCMPTCLASSPPQPGYAIKPSNRSPITNVQPLTFVRDVYDRYR